MLKFIQQTDATQPPSDHTPSLLLSPFYTTTDLYQLTSTGSKHVVLESHVTGGTCAIIDRGDESGTVFGNARIWLDHHVVTFKKK